jgi:aspartyl-tRNA(Asn)/glutamyl-tRNA(Gln) amidotransferase subunit C
MSQITVKDVEYVAALAQLELTDEEKTRLTRELSDIIDHVEQLNSLDTKGVEPMMHTLDIVNVLREDAVEPSLSRDEALKNAPDTDGEYFLVPKILDTGEGA